MIPWYNVTDCSRSHEARHRLVRGMNMPCIGGRGGDCVFADVEPSIGFPSCSWVKTGDGQATKSIIRTDFSSAMNESSCVVYGAGIADDSRFEDSFAADCEVHAFDCTISRASKAVWNKMFRFHELCIGRKPDTAHPSRNYMHLPDIMRMLGHSRIDILKFDIEGHEWNLFPDILNMPSPPLQISFELHTRGSPLPTELVSHADKRTVNTLFIRFFDAGYRVVSKDINDNVRTRSEFVLALGCHSNNNTHNRGCFYDGDKIARLRHNKWIRRQQKMVAEYEKSGFNQLGFTPSRRNQPGRRNPSVSNWSRETRLYYG